MLAVRSWGLITSSPPTLVSLTLVNTLYYFINYFGQRKDFKAIHEVLVNGVGLAGPNTLESAIQRPNDVVSFFQIMEIDYRLKRDKESLLLVMEKLCGNRYASYTEWIVKNLAKEFFPERICDLLVKGWCVDENLDEAKRLVEEMYRSGFEIGTMVYNTILDCVCKICKEDPFRLHSANYYLLPS